MIFYKSYWEISNKKFYIRYHYHEINPYVAISNVNPFKIRTFICTIRSHLCLHIKLMILNQCPFWIKHWIWYNPKGFWTKWYCKKWHCDMTKLLVHLFMHSPYTIRLTNCFGINSKSLLFHKTLNWWLDYVSNVALKFLMFWKIVLVLKSTISFFQLYLSINVKILNISMRYVLHGVTHIKLDLNDNSWITTLPLLLLMKKNLLFNDKSWKGIQVETSIKWIFCMSFNLSMFAMIIDQWSQMVE
jgi:hypothetical protein